MPFIVASPCMLFAAHCYELVVGHWPMVPYGLQGNGASVYKHVYTTWPELHTFCRLGRLWAGESATIALVPFSANPLGNSSSVQIVQCNIKLETVYFAL